MPNLVGIGNSQVPTNAMLGGLAYQDSVGEISIDKIKARTGDTATDVFVYDTRKDSDGGAWRHRTQKTSWYNEVTGIHRGARKEFPAVAIIICISNHIKIYDGDDPNLPLWMDVRGTTARRDHGWMYGSTLNAVTALNGIIAIAANWNIGDEGGVLIMDFVKDELRRHEGTAGRSGGGLSISQRGTSVNLDITQDIPLIVNPYVNDVAITLLPNAPIDSSTGLPTPTIAVATNGGTNVINNDGKTVTQGYQTIATEHVDLHSDGFMTDGISGATNDSFSLYDITQKERLYSYGHRTNTHSIVTYLNEGTGECLFEGKGNKIAIAQSQGLLRIVEILEAEKSNDAISFGLHNRTTSSYNTGWMAAESKGAFLSDTDDTDITGSELSSNPGPFSNTTNWTVDNSHTISASNNRLVINSGSNAVSYFGAYHDFTTVVGRKYVLTVDIHSQNKTAVVRLSGSGTYFTETGLGTGIHVFYFTSDQASTTVRIGSDVGGSNREQQINSISIREVEEDRSAYGKGTGIHGTVPKQAVATGAELVSYGPFSTTNRLRQPYNSEFNFETNDFSIMFWMYNTGTNSHQTFVSRDDREFDVSILDNDTYSRRFRIYADQSDNSSNHFDSNDDPFPLNVWSHVCVNFTGGSACAVYVNGVLNKAGDLNYDIDDTAHGLNIGARYESGSYAHAADGTKLALVRISKSAPTPEQIKKIYHDEKCLYYDNAQATLYGTSDAVTALAHDNSNNILHVGTSAGRSEFQGLNRINNTTTAVTTTISASNGLVAEQ